MHDGVGLTDEGWYGWINRKMNGLIMITRGKGDRENRQGMHGIIERKNKLNMPVDEIGSIIII